MSHQIIVVSDGDMKKLLEHQEQHAMEELRASLRLESLDDAKQRFEFATLRCETTLHIVEDAYTQLEEDPSDDFELAQAKSDKLDHIEREHDRAIRAWENQLKRMNWESRQAQAAT